MALSKIEIPLAYCLFIRMTRTKLYFLFALNATVYGMLIGGFIYIVRPIVSSIPSELVNFLIALAMVFPIVQIIILLYIFELLHVQRRRERLSSGASI